MDRTTESIGFVRDYTLMELKKLHIYADVNQSQQIPIIDEVFDLIEPRLETDMKLNIELKNSVYPYPGMEEKIVELVHKRGLEKAIVYSSIHAKSLEKVRNLDQETEIGILDNKVSDCFYKLKGGCDAQTLHPFWKGIDLLKEDLNGITVRAYLSGHLYTEKPTGTMLNLGSLEMQGIIDVILNEPEMYLN